MFNPTLIRRLCAGGLLIVFHKPAAHACALHARHQHRTRENALAKFPGGTVRAPSRSGPGRVSDRC